MREKILACLISSFCFVNIKSFPCITTASVLFFPPYMLLSLVSSNQDPCHILARNRALRTRFANGTLP